MTPSRNAAAVACSASSFWTGREPLRGQCPGVKADGTITSLPQLKLDATRKEFRDYFDNGWTLTEVLFSGLTDEAAFYRRPYHKLRHPMIFYYAHPAVLYVNKLRVAGLLDGPVNAEFERFFETGVDEMRWDDLHEGQDVWPPVAEVQAYRRQVYDAVCRVIDTHPLLGPGHPPVTQDSPLWALVMGFEHERIHLETSSVLMRELPVECLRRPSQWPADAPQGGTKAPANVMVNIEATRVQLGKPDDFPTFGWDNEYGSETREVAGFRAAKYLASNAEFHAFVVAGGYADERYWSKEGWEWRRFRNIKCPPFWVMDGPAGLHRYKLRTIFEVVEMKWSWPVCVNFHEAKAYCAWRSEQDVSGRPYRLLSEAEHRAIRDEGDGPDSANSGLRHGSEGPVDGFAAGRQGLHDVFGNLWQWCEDYFHPLAGAQPHPYYDDFSTPCYDGQHQMIFGGSFASTGDEASVWARFHFRPHFHQHAGFRIVQGERDDGRSEKSDAQSYESQAMLAKYMLMHWGEAHEIYDTALAATVDFPKVVELPLACAELTVRFATGFARALDLGCAVGRSSFELARRFGEVTGIDYSHEFIAAAAALQRDGRLDYDIKNQGDDFYRATAKVDAAIRRERVRFAQGDACALPDSLREFDAVLLANVLCRLPDPALCLRRMQGKNALVKKGGVLVMTTPLSWLEQYTPPKNWLRGFEDIGKLLPEFDLVHQEEMPFMIREHRRKFEYIVTQASVWRRR